jgi:small subunit ribosomal protein S5
MTNTAVPTKSTNKPGGRRESRGRRGGRGRKQEKPEFDQKIIDVARVTRVTEGGKQMSFRATVAIGDRKGKVGVGLGKGQDVSNAINKAVDQAKKNMIVVPLDQLGTIPHEVKTKFGAALVMVRPAAQGTGIIAGGIMRMILELSGVRNVVAKMYGSKSKINNAKATIEALRSLQTKNARKQMRG